MLITRPEPGASETAARLEALGFRPIVAPLLEIRALRAALPPAARVQAILATSANAVKQLPAEYTSIPMFAVGDATAARARAAGFGQVSSAQGDASALAALTAQSCPPNGLPLLLVSGRGQGIPLTDALRVQGFRVIRRAVYSADPVKTLSDVARAALVAGALYAALFFSAETARHFVRLLQRTDLRDTTRDVVALAIGEPAAVALEALPWRQIRVAERPNQDAMLALLP